MSLKLIKYCDFRFKKKKNHNYIHNNKNYNQIKENKIFHNNNFICMIEYKMMFKNPTDKTNASHDCFKM